MATAQANAAAPLDQLLVDAGAALRRWLPGHLGVEFIASMAGSPRRSESSMASTMDGDQKKCLRELRFTNEEREGSVTMSETPISSRPKQP